MATVIAIHSYSGGTGRSTLAANLASLLALAGNRVGVLDVSLQSPGMSISYGLDYDRIDYTFNDYLRDRCEVSAIAYKVFTKQVESGAIFVIPASTKSEDIAAVLTEGYDLDLLQESVYTLDCALNLDFILLDVQAGINEEIMNVIPFVDYLMLVLCPDPQDYLGTGMIIDLANNLGAPKMILVINKVLPEDDLVAIEQAVEANCHDQESHILPFSMTMMRIGNESTFCFDYPDHPLTQAFQKIASEISEGDKGDGDTSSRS